MSRFRKRSASIGRLVVVLVAMFLACPSGAAPIPPVASRIPRDASFVLFISNADQALPALGQLIKPFSAISQEIDLVRLGDKLAADIGFNPLTREGLAAAGINVSGCAALFMSGNLQDPVLAFPLADPVLFKTKLFESIARHDKNFNRKPMRKSGVEIYSTGGGLIGLKGSWCFLQPNRPMKGRPEVAVMAFFKNGAKLASSRTFKKSWSRMPDGLHVGLYLDLRKLKARFDRQMSTQIERLYKNKHLTPKQRKHLAKYFKQERRQLGASFRLVGFVDSFGASWTIEAKAIKQTAFLATGSKGHRTLKAMLPALSSAPAFHDPLAESAVAGAWTSLSIGAVLKHFGSLELYPGFKLSDAIKREGAGARGMLGIDPFKDGLAALKGPMAAYLLTPPDTKIDAGQDPGSQIAGLIRFAVLAQIGSAAKARAFLDKFSAFVSAKKLPIQTRTVSGISVTVFSPRPALEIAWGIKGDSFFLAFGKNTADSLAKILPEHAWTGVAATGTVGSGVLDFATLGESMSSAVARGVGGRAGMGFRMTVWPMVQQVLAKLNRLTFDGRFESDGLISTGQLSIR